MVSVVNEEEGVSVVQAGAPILTGASKYAVVEAPETMPNSEEPLSDTAEEGDSDSNDGAAADDVLTVDKGNYTFTAQEPGNFATASEATALAIALG